MNAPAHATDAPAAAAADALAEVVGGCERAEARPGQQQMAEAVARAIAEERHLVVQAGTGTGKTMGYLVPAVLSGKKVVVATATKALQDQLASKDLPFLTEQLLAHDGRELKWAVLKGRNNYACLQRIQEFGDDGAQLALEPVANTVKVEVKRLVEWSDTTRAGDVAELDWTPSDQAWRAVSVGSDECPGARRCPNGGPCFAERARERAADADVVVVNMHLYGLHVGSGGALLPEHDVVVFDEAHMLEDIVSDTVGVEIGPSRLTFLAAALTRVLTESNAAVRLADDSLILREALRPLVGKRLPPDLDPAVAGVLRHARTAVDTALSELRKVKTEVDDVKQQALRATTLATRLGHRPRSGDDRQRRTGAPSSAAGPSTRKLEIAPLDVGPVLDSGVWTPHAAVLTSATIPASLPQRVGLVGAAGKPVGRPVEVLDVGSPFDYQANALLYCAVHMPDPRSADFVAKTHEELIALITAAGGRTLALFTSWKAMDAAAEAVRARLDLPILTQRDKPKPALLKEFADDEATSLFATAGLFQGVDIPGRSLSLVVIDRIPFPRPDDPLLSARRELLGPVAFRQIDLPACIHPARPGDRAADPHRRRPRRGRRARPAARQGRLPVGDRQRTAAHAAHAPPRRGRGVPARDHGMSRYPMPRTVMISFGSSG